MVWADGRDLALKEVNARQLRTACYRIITWICNGGNWGSQSLGELESREDTCKLQDHSHEYSSDPTDLELTIVLRQEDV